MLASSMNQNRLHHPIKSSGVLFSSSPRQKSNRREQTQASFTSRVWKSKSPTIVESNQIKGGSIIFEDEYIAAINKDSGIAVHSGSKLKKSDSLTGELEKRGWRLVHRLDKDTSGLLLVAKTQEAARRMTELFDRSTSSSIKKEYLVITFGAPKILSGSIKMPCRLQDAESRYAVLSTSKHNDLALLKMSPLSGRKRQLRIHCRHGLGFGVAGDTKFTSITPMALKLEKERTKLCLHSHKVTFVHPFTNTEMIIECPMPLYMTKLCERFSLSTEDRGHDLFGGLPKPTVWTKPIKGRRDTLKEPREVSERKIVEKIRTTAPVAKEVSRISSSSRTERVVSIGYGRMRTGLFRRETVSGDQE